MTDRVVLVPLDGSALAAKIVPYADAIARSLRAGLRLLRVIDVEDEAGRIRAEEVLAATAQTIPGNRGRVSIQVDAGNPLRRILAHAAAPEVALVALATHGRFGLARTIEGGLADALILLSPRPVFITVPGPRPPEKSIDLRRLIVPLDGSDLAEAALPLALELAAGSDACLTLLRSLPTPTSSDTAAHPLAGLGEWSDPRGRFAAAYLQRVRSALPVNQVIQTAVLRGASACAVIERFANITNADLIIMSMHGDGGLRRFALGSTGEHLLQSGLPMLFVRPQIDERHRDAERALMEATLAGRSGRRPPGGVG
jgi:nucleotide-binding universal stress UspA family protein